MTALDPQTDPIDLPEGATIRRPDPKRPFVAMSNRKRWSKCALSAVLPQLRTPSGPPAEEGTQAHVVAEWALGERFGIGAPGQPVPVVDPPAGLNGFDYSERGVADWRHLVTEYAKTYAGNAGLLFSNAPGTTNCMIECKFEDVTIHGVRVFTVADVVLWNAQARRLVVGDYKFGRSPVGVGTMAAPNEQCAGAAALWSMQAKHLEPAQIGLFVYQPRTLAGEAWQPIAELDPDKASAWLANERQKLDDELAAVAAAADGMSRGELVPALPGDHCKHCPSARWCPAVAEFGTVALDVDAGRRAVVDLSPEEVAALWASRKAFDAFTDDLKERVRILVEQNHPALSVKRRVGNRIWLDPAKTAEALMLKDRYDLLQPPGIEKAAAALDKAEMDALTTRAGDVLTYVPTAGKQPDTARDAFAKYLPKEV